MDAETERILVEVEGDTDAISLELEGEDIKDVMAADAWSPFSLDYMESSSGASPRERPSD